MVISILKVSLFTAFVVLLSWKAVRGLVATEEVVRDRAYGAVATKPIQAGLVAIVTAAVCFGGYWFAEFSYLWLAIGIINLFVLLLIFGQSRVHDRAAGIDAVLALSMDKAQMAKQIRARRWESVGQIAVVLLWVYAWRNTLGIT
jgi:hypothetical protein